jgi:hypothetical protein
MTCLATEGPKVLARIDAAQRSRPPVTGTSVGGLAQ